MNTGNTGSAELITAKEFAALVGVTTHTVRTWIKEGRLPAKRYGRLVRIERRHVEQGVPEKANKGE